MQGGSRFVRCSALTQIALWFVASLFVLVACTGSTKRESLPPASSASATIVDAGADAPSSTDATVDRFQCACMCC